MANESKAIGSRSSRIVKVILKVIGTLVVSIVVLLVGTHLVWKYSGSGQWRLVSDRDGIQVYSKKIPGDARLKFKGHTSFPQRVGSAVTAMLDVHLDGCQQFFPGCKSVKPIETWDSSKMYQTYMWQVSFTPKMKPREFLLQTKVLPDPAARAVTVEFLAQPDRLPRDPCCYRIEHLDNTWTFSQAPGGKLDVVFAEDMDIGTPYFMMNLKGPEIIHGMLADLPGQFNDPSYQGKTPDYLPEFAQHD